MTLPGDIAGLEATADTPLPAAFVPATLVPAPKSVQRLADAINSAEKVAIFAGAGVQGAHDEVIALAELVRAPIGHSLRGKD